MSLPDIVGLIGVAAYITGYAALQLERLTSDDDRYLLLNGLGSGLILASLFYSFNLPSFITQALWLVFTVIGFYRVRTKRRAAGG